MPWRPQLLLAGGAALAFVLPAWPTISASAAQPEPASATDPVADVSTRIAEHLKEPTPAVDGAPLRERDLLVRFYARRGYRPAWTVPGTATALHHAVLDAYTHGLRPEDYHADALAAHARANDTDAADLRDLLHSDAFLHLGRHLGGGAVDPRGQHRGYARGDSAPDPAEALEALLPDGDPAAALAALAPPHPEYGRLREALARLRAEPFEAACPGLPDGPLVRPGQRHARVVKLRACLTGGADAPPRPEAAARLDPALTEALRNFQRRHHLAADGILGPLTTAALVASSNRRVERLRANLERWRWQPRDFGRRAVRVDIPQYRLRAFAGPAPRLEMAVVVGCRGWRTPLVHSAIEEVVLNPAWNVPRSIFVKEMLPSARRDAGYFARHGLELTEERDGIRHPVDPASVDWASVDPERANFRARQPPGPRNPLGKVKFIFPNAYGVYLHGTPGRAALEHPVRALSHGCVRVEDERSLARFALAPDPAWTDQRLDDALKNPANERRVKLLEPLPVHLLFFTAEVDAEGALSFVPDPYGWDARLVDALDAGPH